MGIYRGVALLLTDGKAVVGLPSSFGYLAEGQLFGVVPVDGTSQFDNLPFLRLEQLAQPRT